MVSRGCMQKINKSEKFWKRWQEHRTCCPHITGSAAYRITKKELGYAPDKTSADAPVISYNGDLPETKDERIDRVIRAARGKKIKLDSGV